MDELTVTLLDARAGDRLALGVFIRATQGEVWRLTAHLVDTEEADGVTLEPRW